MVMQEGPPSTLAVHFISFVISTQQHSMCFCLKQNAKQIHIIMISILIVVVWFFLTCLNSEGILSTLAIGSCESGSGLDT